MAKVCLICGMLCSGKSTLARRMAEENSAVILSVDELTRTLADDLGEAHDSVAAKVQAYLRRKAVEIVRAGTDVILDWGFWRRADRAESSRYFFEHGVTCEWHYIDVSPERLRRQIDARNASPGPWDYLVDEGLFQKCASAFEAPDAGEIDVWHKSAIR